MNVESEQLHCACLIHGNAYDWKYVDVLYNMLVRNITRPIVLHVFTEADRSVPEPYVKHELVDWGLAGPKKSWWYKIQMFNPEHHSGMLLYFDLDVVITKNIDWIWKLNQQFFWTIKDFKHIWRPTHQGINSSIMFWDTKKYANVWEEFQRRGVADVTRHHHGDQDYITEVLDPAYRRYFDNSLVKSWRWQAKDGGYDFEKRRWFTPGTGTNISDGTAILIFHGNPKPAVIDDPIVKQFWH